MRDPLAELTAIRRLLRPGGLVLQSSPNIDGLYPRLSVALARRPDYWPHLGPPSRLYQFSDRTLPELIERAGYEVTRIDQTTIRPGYGFGVAMRRTASPGLRAHAALLGPIAIAGRWLGMGDWLYIAARRPA